MKGVTFIRATFHPVAECLEDGCGQTFRAGHFNFVPAVTIRSQAQHHVRDTGHVVTVTVSDVTRYMPDSEPDEAASELTARGARGTGE